jgi:hypothetical protein
MSAVLAAALSRARSRSAGCSGRPRPSPSRSADPDPWPFGVSRERRGFAPGLSPGRQMARMLGVESTHVAYVIADVFHPWRLARSTTVTSAGAERGPCRAGSTANHCMGPFGRAGGGWMVWVPKT